MFHTCVHISELNIPTEVAVFQIKLIVFEFLSKHIKIYLQNEQVVFLGIYFYSKIGEIDSRTDDNVKTQSFCILEKIA